MSFTNSIPLSMWKTFRIERIQSTFCRWPVLSTCLSVTCASFLLFFAFAAAGWPGSVTSNCYEDYLVNPDCFCERLRGTKPGDNDVWIAQPVNTISNLWFVLVGLLIAYTADAKRLPASKECCWWEHNHNLMTQDRLYSQVFALDACLLGVGSSFFHASFTTWGRQLDMIAMYWIASFLLLYPLLREGRITKQQAVWTYCCGNMCLMYWTVRVATPESSRRLFTTIITTSWAYEILMVDPEWAKLNSKGRRIFYVNLAMFCVAAIQWKASESGGPLCLPDSIFQGHSLWHFQGALGIGGSFLYYLAELGTPSSSSSNTKRRFMVENTPSTSITITTSTDSLSESSAVDISSETGSDSS
jgi:hypothetical protein